MMRLVWLLLGGWCGMASAAIRFNEVCYDPAGADAGLEWIELMNTGPSGVSLGGWLLDCNGPNAILPDLTIGPGQVVVIHHNSAAGQTPTEDEIWFTLSSLGNTHGFLGLWSSESQVAENLVDYVEYGSPGHSWEGQAVERGIWPLGGFLPDVAEGHSLRHQGVGEGLAAWIDDPAPLPGQGDTTVGAGDPDRPADLGLRAWPNPFNPATHVSFQLAATTRTRLSLMDLLGRELRLLVDERLGPGRHMVELDLTGQPAGPYFLRLEAGGRSAVSKILLVK